MKMGEVKEKITLVNLKEEGLAHGGYIKESEIHKLEVTAVVDTGAMRLVIDEATRQNLGLEIAEDGIARLADGQLQHCKYTEPVLIRWKNRNSVNKAMVLPGSREVLLGVIPLEEMDLRVNSVDQCLEGVHGDDWVQYAR
jgi:clan AA aspartic protease